MGTVERKKRKKTELLFVLLLPPSALHCPPVCWSYSCPMVDPHRTARRRSHLFDPWRYRNELIAIIREISRAEVPEGSKTIDPRVMNAILRRYPRDGKGLFSHSHLIKGFRTLSPQVDFDLSEQAFVERVQLRPVRTLSGVTPITIFTAPFPCPGRCIFCPNDDRVPKSYLADEPVSQRAMDSLFDPYLQTWTRLSAFRAIGHPTDKAEVIISGGTWSSYPEAYQRWFVSRCFEAMNDFGRSIDNRDRIAQATDPASLGSIDPALGATTSRYNRALVTRRFTGAQVPPMDWPALRSTQLANESGLCRCVGLSIETRPDRITHAEVVRLRRLGCTKVQIGCQSLSDEILALNQRGHKVAATRRAIRLLRQAGFKIMLHWMANLLGSTPEQDKRDFIRLFDDPDFRPDELKIYPCSLVENTALMDFYQKGEWRPYTHDELLDLLKTALVQTPYYCRLNRVIRDIGSNDIVVGNKMSNFREIAERTLVQEGLSSAEIRSREIRGQPFEIDRLKLRVSGYQTSIGEERFLQFVSEHNRLAGFLRLSLPQIQGFIPEIDRSALIREIRVYGASLSLGTHDSNVAQHRGLGQRLIQAAAQCTTESGFNALAVISAVGTRDYYRRLGFSDGELYQHQSLTTKAKG